MFNRFFDKIKCKRHEAKGIVLCLILILLIFVFDDGVICYFKGALGIPCPGCGFTRSFVSLYKLDFYSAFYYHPLWPLVIIFVVVSVLAFFIPRVASIVNNRYYYPVICFILIVVYAVRMIFMFPNVPPMDFNDKAILWRIIGLVREVFRL